MPKKSSISRTRTIGLRALRENLPSLLREAQVKNVHFIVLRHNVPIAHVTPVTASDSLEALIEDVAVARAQAKRGETYSQEEVETMLGL